MSGPIPGRPRLSGAIRHWRDRAEAAEGIVATDKHIKADLWRKFSAAEAEVKALREIRRGDLAVVKMLNDEVKALRERMLALADDIEATVSDKAGYARMIRDALAGPVPAPEQTSEEQS